MAFGCFLILLIKEEFIKFFQLLSLDLETVINEGMVSLSKKQVLIDEALEQSYEIALGGGTFGHCLVNFINFF